MEADVDGLNPTSSALSVSGLAMGNAVFDTLAAPDENGDWVPYLAESFTPSEDLRSWTMKLRPGITFHDGTPLDTAAVQVNFETQRGDFLVGLAVAPFFPAEGATEIIDDLTIVYNLIDPDARFPSSLTGALGMVSSPAWLEAALEDPTLNQAPVGTGPFVFESRSEDSVTRFVRNENWWNGRAFLDAVEFVTVTDSDNRTQFLLEGDLQIMHTTNVGSIAQLAENPEIQNILDDTGEESFAMMNTNTAPFDDIRVRQALTFATPRDNYNLLINQGVTRQADQMFTPESPYYNPDVVQEGDTPELSGPLVEAYCADVPDSCTDGKVNIELQWSGPSVVQTRIADLLTEAWSPFFNVTPQELLQDAHIQETAFGQYQVNTWRQFGAGDPSKDNVWLLCKTIGGLSLNWPRLCDEERDAALLGAQAATDEAERTAFFQEAVQLINDSYVYIFFNHTLWDVALSSETRNVCAAASPEGVTLQCVTNGRARFDTIFLSE